MTLITTARTSIAAFALFLLAAAAPSIAADTTKGSLKDKPIEVPSWEGAYFGFHLGGAWGNIETNRNVFREPDGKEDGAFIFTPFFGKEGIEGSGFFGGGQFGYNWQGGSNCCLVYGIEIDLGGMDAGGKDHPFTAVREGKYDTLIAAVRVKDEGSGFYGDVTGRLGYTWGSALLYIKGGFAWLNTNLAAHEVLTTVTNTKPPVSTVMFARNNDNDNTLTGWTVGAGIEYMLGTSWSLKLEYLHFDFGNEDHGCCFDNFGNDFHFFRNDLTVETVKVGVNYHIPSTVAALPYK